ncbi:MAG TPA: hypothetical protein GX529_06235, partial [Firmicutes bacterium]|nr:hypothetical protein [Candidatus Fermentithermobacillaceae bacterium]
MTTGGKTALVEAYRDFDARCATVLDRFKNAREYEAGLYVPCKEDRQEATKQLETLLDEVSNLPAPGPVCSSCFVASCLSSLQGTYKPASYSRAFLNLSSTVA